MDRIPPEKQAEHDEIAMLTKAFLKRGGKIQKIGNGPSEYAKSGVTNFTVSKKRRTALE